MRLLKLFSLVAIFTLLATYVKADQAPEAEFSNDWQTEEIAGGCFNKNTQAAPEETLSEEKNSETQPANDVILENEMIEEPYYDQGHSLKEEQLMQTYNFPARIDVKEAWDVFLLADYIYWQQKERGLEYGLIVPANVATTDYKTAKMSFDYKSGFKVTLGTNFEHDNWTALVEYVRLHGIHKSSFSAPTNGYITSFFIYNSNLTNNASKMKGRWSLSYDILNVEFARPCYVGTQLTLRPYIGMTGGWINQTMKTIGTYLTDTFTIYAKTYTNSWLIGPRFGLDTNWFLGAGFDLKADIAAGLPYQKIKSSFKQQSGYYSYSLAYRMSEKISQITPEIEGTLGFGWGTYFNEHKWNFSCQALYDFVYYFDQNHMRKLADLQLRQVKIKPNDLILHGLTVALRLDF